MNLYLIENDSSVDSILSSDHYSPGQDIIICFNYLCYLRLKKEKDNHLFFFTEDLLNKQDYKQLHNITDFFAQNWYKSNGIDQTLYQGLSLGKLVEITFSRTYMLSILVKYGEVIRKVVQKWPDIDTLYYDLCNSENYFFLYGDDRGKFFNKQMLVQSVAQQLKLKTYFLEAANLIPSKCVVYKHAFPLRRAIKQKIIFAIYSSISILIQIFYFNQKQKNQIYILGISHKKSILSHLSPSLILSSHITWLTILKALFTGTSLLDFDQIKYRLNISEEAFIESLKEKFLKTNNEQFLNYTFSYNNIDYSPLYMNTVKDLIVNVFPHLLNYTGKVRKGIRKKHIGTIIINEENDEKLRAVLYASHLEGKQSVFVDHGIMGINQAQKVCNRDLSDVVVCSGDFYKSYYMDHSKHKREYHSFGNPSMDPYPIQKRKKISKIKNVLFLTYQYAFYGRLDRFAYQGKYFEEIYSTFDELDSLGIEIYYRPHPGERREYHDYLMNFFSVDQKKINYIDNQSFTSLIRDMDLVISNTSTCYFESIAAGVPTIFMEPYLIPGSLLLPCSSQNPEEVIRVSTGKEIIQIVKDNYKDPEKLNNFVERFLTLYSNNYIGQLDGNAWKRILDYINSCQ